MDFIIVMKGILCTGGGGGKVSIFKSHNLRKFTGFLCGYGRIKRDKTYSIASILMKFYTLIVNINRDFY